MNSGPETAIRIAAPLGKPYPYINPVLDQDFPDPDVLRVNGNYYAYATNSRGINVQLARSSNLVDWELLPDAMPKRAPWVFQDFGWTWAPNVIPMQDGQRYLMYYTARLDRRIPGRPHCMAIGVAESADPEGPFIPRKEPLISQVDQGGSIDLAGFLDDDGARYLVWKNDGNSCGKRSWIYIQQVAEDGVTLRGQPRRLITADLPWEGCLVEAPTLWKYGDLYYLFYSANYFLGPEYGVGYAVADHPLGPYRKAPDPLLTTDPDQGRIGPGGQDLVTAADGTTWILFHAWGSENSRVLNLAELIWDGHRPVIRCP